jgi:sulfur-oxidizing protein SoxY
MTRARPMPRETGTLRLTRRSILVLAGAGSLSTALAPPAAAVADEDPIEVVRRLTGKTAVESERVHLAMPPKFPTGYTVPLSLTVDTPMTTADHVRNVRIFAPLNPIVEVVNFHFTPDRSEARVSTRIRLAKPQFVLAVAEMNDGALLMAKTWVAVATDGCA